LQAGFNIGEGRGFTKAFNSKTLYQAHNYYGCDVKGRYIYRIDTEKGNHISKNRPNILAISEGKIVADLSSYIETSLKKYLVSEIDICFDFE